MKTTFLIPLLALLIACNSTNKPMTAAQKEAVKEEAALVITDVFNVLSSADSEKRMSICENSPDFSFTLAEGILSYDGLKSFASQAFQGAEKELFETRSEKYIVLNPDCFIYVWEGKIEIHMNSGKILAYNDYYSTWTFRKSDGVWKMINGHESFRLPLQAED